MVPRRLPLLPAPAVLALLVALVGPAEARSRTSPRNDPRTLVFYAGLAAAWVFGSAWLAARLRRATLADPGIGRAYVNLPRSDLTVRWSEGGGGDDGDGGDGGGGDGGGD